MNSVKNGARGDQYGVCACRMLTGGGSLPTLPLLAFLVFVVDVFFSNMSFRGFFLLKTHKSDIS